MSLVNVFNNTSFFDRVVDDGAKGTEQIAKESMLLALKVVDMKGDIFRIVFGKKTLVTTQYLGEPDSNEIPDNAVVYTKEAFAGRDDLNFTVTTVELEGNTQNSEPDISFDFTKLSDYHMESFVFDYQVIPTLDKGPKLIKTFVSPVLNHTFKGSLTQNAIMTEAFEQSRGNMNSQDMFKFETGIPATIAQHIKITANTKLQETISL